MTLLLSETYFATGYPDRRVDVTTLAGLLIVDLAAAGLLEVSDGRRSWLGIPRSWAQLAGERPDHPVLGRAHDRVAKRRKPWTVSTLSMSLIPEFLISEAWIERGWVDKHGGPLTTAGREAVGEVSAQPVVELVLGREHSWAQHSDPAQSVPGRWDLVLRDVRVLNGAS